MRANATILISILFLSMLMFLASRYLVRRFAFKNREPRTLEDVYNSDAKTCGIRYDTFSDVYRALGACYSIDNKLVRPHDPLKKFFDVDSFDLDAGTERLDEWLSKTFGIEGRQEKIDTVLDLLVLIEKSRK